MYICTNLFPRPSFNKTLSQGLGAEPFPRVSFFKVTPFAQGCFQPFARNRIDLCPLPRTASILLQGTSFARIDLCPLSRAASILLQGTPFARIDSCPLSRAASFCKGSCPLTRAAPFCKGEQALHPLARVFGNSISRVGCHWLLSHLQGLCFADAVLFQGFHDFVANQVMLRAPSGWNLHNKLPWVATPWCQDTCDICSLGLLGICLSQGIPGALTPFLKGPLLPF